MKETTSCKGCGKVRVKTPTTKEYCLSCSCKKRWGTLGIKEWKKECKQCGDIRVFTWRKTWSNSGDLCVSCSQIKNTSHYNRKLQKYRGKVWSATNRQPLHTLPNIEKRGKSGIEGAYQLDHIISIKEGFDKGIEPEIIGSIDNLQMISWRENRNKGCK